MGSTLNGIPVLRLTVDEPLAGAWVADVELDTHEEVSGDADLIVEGVLFAGSVFRGGQQRGRWRGRLVGGRGSGSGRGPRALVSAKHYRGTVLRLVLSDVAAAMGEIVDTAGSDASALNLSLGQWVRSAGPAGHALRALGDEAGARHHLTREGLLRFAAPSYELLEPSSAAELLDEDPAAGRATYAVGAPEFLPDRSVGDRRCSYVLTEAGSKGLRQTLWFES